MQSIHNFQTAALCRLATVCDISKIRNVVNSQPCTHASVITLYCLRYIKDTKCSQFTTCFVPFLFIVKLFAIYQRYEMQSIHNQVAISVFTPFTVCDISKIRNVVNSQHGTNTVISAVHCLRYIKDTKCSQFTTATPALGPTRLLFAIYQRYEMQSIHNREH